jgi:hypothetical protein
MWLILSGKHHILRLDEENDFEVVLKRQKYFTSMTSVNGWRQKTTVIFLKNTPDGDGIVGAGCFDYAEKYVNMRTDDKIICERTGSKFLVKLNDLVPLRPPKLVKETAIGNWGINGKMLHGKSLSDKELSTVLS